MAGQLSSCSLYSFLDGKEECSAGACPPLPAVRQPNLLPIQPRDYRQPAPRLLQLGMPAETFGPT